MDICIYLRKSRAEENMSIQEVLRRHRQTLLSYAEKNNFNVLDIKEEIVSGESILRRPKMLALLDELDNSLYDGVLVMDMDRLSRGNMKEQGLILETFKESHTLIMTPNKTYDLSNDFDEDFTEFEAFMARRELKIIKKRLQRGREKSLEEGNYISPYPPFGYDKHKKTLLINEENSKIVILIYDLYVNKGYGDAKIANHLTSLGINTARGISRWDKTSIRKILSNPIYIGKVTWKKRSYKVNKEGKIESKTLDKAQWSIYNGRHEPIIDEATFSKAQTICANRRSHRTHSNKHLVNPLAKILKCAVCGSTMTLRTSKNKSPSIRCYKNCGLKSSYLSIVEDPIIQQVYTLLEDLEYNFTFSNESLDTERRNLLSIKKSHEQNKVKALTQRSKVFELLEQGVYSIDIFKDRISYIDSNIEILKNSISSLDSRLKKIDTIYGDIKGLYSIEDINGFKKLFTKLNPEERNLIYSTLFQEIIYTKERTWAKDEFDLTFISNL